MDNSVGYHKKDMIVIEIWQEKFILFSCGELFVSLKLNTALFGHYISPEDKIGCVYLQYFTSELIFLFATAFYWTKVHSTIVGSPVEHQNLLKFCSITVVTGLLSPPKKIVCRSWNEMCVHHRFNLTLSQITLLFIRFIFSFHSIVDTIFKKISTTSE